MARDSSQVTLVDVARAAGVSRTTASAALSGTGRIAARTRERVASVAEEMGYVANPAARNLRSGRRGAVALYVPERLMGYAFYMEFAFGVAQRARSSGVAISLVAAAPAGGLRTLLAHVDAFILVDPLTGDPFVEAVVACDLPVVAAERVLSGPQPTTTVETDHEGALVALLDHLWDQGARSPALSGSTCRSHGRGWSTTSTVGGAPPTGSSPGSRRSPRSPARCRPRRRPGPARRSRPARRHRGRARRRRARRPRRGARRGAPVGEDLLVASCVDSLALQLTSPPVTAIDLRPREIGTDVATVALALADGGEVARVIRRSRPHLELRESTARRAAPQSATARGPMPLSFP